MTIHHTSQPFQELLAFLGDLFSLLWCFFPPLHRSACLQMIIWPNTKKAAKITQQTEERNVHVNLLTCAFDSPKPAAISSRSAGDKYFWYKNRFSSSKIWWFVNAVRDFRFFFGCGRVENKSMCGFSADKKRREKRKFNELRLAKWHKKNSNHFQLLWNIKSQLQGTKSFQWIYRLTTH
jgi:hypothetical protein